MSVAESRNRTLRCPTDGAALRWFDESRVECPRCKNINEIAEVV